METRAWQAMASAHYNDAMPRMHSLLSVLVVLLLNLLRCVLHTCFRCLSGHLEPRLDCIDPRAAWRIVNIANCRWRHNRRAAAAAAAVKPCKTCWRACKHSTAIRLMPSPTRSIAAAAASFIAVPIHLQLHAALGDAAQAGARRPQLTRDRASKCNNCYV